MFSRQGDVSFSRIPEVPVAQPKHSIWRAQPAGGYIVDGANTRVTNPEQPCTGPGAYGQPKGTIHEAHLEQRRRCDHTALAQDT